MANKPLLSGFEKIILIGLILFFGYSFFKKGSFKMVERTEETTILDGKTSAATYRELDQKEKSISKKSPTTDKLDTDDVLGKLARTFSKGRAETNRQMKELGLSKDEIKYYKDVQKETNLTEQVQSAKDWFTILKTSASTYGKVKSFINDLGVKEGENVNVVLEDSASSNDFYKNLENTFGISEVEAKAFGSLGKKKVSDWAKFIEEKSKE